MFSKGTSALSSPTRSRYGIFFPLAVGLFMALCVLLPALPAFAAKGSVPDAGTVRADGRVYAILQVGDKIYMAGNFYHVDNVERKRFAAIDANTGELTDWSPKANASVFSLAASPDGSRIYAGGEFTRSNEADRDRLVALDAVTGETIEGWNAAANAPVRSIAVAGNRVYLGGQFTKVNGTRRERLAMVSGSDGSVSRSWSANATGLVHKVAVSPDGSRVYAGGYFKRIAGRSVPRLAALSPGTGKPVGRQPKVTRPVLDMVVSNSRVFTAEGGTGGGAVAAYGTKNGVRAWTRVANGDCQAIALHKGRLYVGGHFDRLDGKIRRRLAAVSPTGALVRTWAPPANLAVWELTSDATHGKLYAGGDFTTIANRAHPKFASFTI